MASRFLPHFASGVVIKGFGRGSKQLGIPTANFPEEVINALPDDLPTGVYYGFASIDDKCYKMVMSVGWNPFYNNTKKSMETHILHQFDEDFYGKMLKVIMLGFIRPERNFSNLDDLIKAIKCDIEEAEKELDKDDYASFRDHSFFKN